MNKLVAVGILVVLCGCSNKHHEARWFSKNGTNCAMVRFNEAMGEWDVVNNLSPAIFVEEKDAIAFARNMCGGGDIKMALAASPTPKPQLGPK